MIKNHQFLIAPKFLFLSLLSLYLNEIIFSANLSLKAKHIIFREDSYSSYLE